MRCLVAVSKLRPCASLKARTRMLSGFAKDPSSHLTRIAFVGDVHGMWGPPDEAALALLAPDVSVFVGDFGEEDVELVRLVSQSREPKAVMLGNHDAWFSLTERGRQRYFQSSGSLQDSPGVSRQLALLASTHLGYSQRQFPDKKLSLVGARPFSKGGGGWDDMAAFYSRWYGIHSFQESAAAIAGTILEQPDDHAVVVVGHNGPTGLGGRSVDMCGVDWRPEGGDHGDVDLRRALDTAHAAGCHVSLVAFGHMHHILKDKGARNMIHIHPATGTVFLNCAVVPRVVPCADDAAPPVPTSPRGASRSDGSSGGVRRHSTLRHFCVVELDKALVVSVRNVWLRVAQLASGMWDAEVAEERPLLRVVPSDVEGFVERTIYKAGIRTWVAVASSAPCYPVCT